MYLPSRLSLSNRVGISEELVSATTSVFEEATTLEGVLLILTSSFSVPFLKPSVVCKRLIARWINEPIVRLPSRELGPSFIYDG